ncbi:MAG TPA: PilN domain-containing protein [Patescibacteria group bacterium]|nr:PilN domain-containing protein [Patescibacteria group bacterium]
MIQLNLLPAVKIQYIKAERSRRIALSLAVLISIAAITILILLLGYDGYQIKTLGDLKKDISDDTKTLQDKPNINKILTVQNQLTELTSLHSGKPAADRLFNYLNQITPTQVNINSLTCDFVQKTLNITGTTNALSSVNQYVDVLKNTSFTIGTDKSKQPAFSSIVLSSFGVNSGSKTPDQAINYTIGMSFDKAIFDNTKDTNLQIESGVITHSSKPDSPSLFQFNSAQPGGT